MRILKTAAVCGLMFVSTFANAYTGFTASMAFTSDYVFRGISQTDNAPAIQGSIQASIDVPFAPAHEVYAGVWGSNVDFDAGGDAGKATIETDWYFGLTGPAFGFTYDGGVIWYNYNQANGLDYIEGFISVSRDFEVATIGGEFHFSPDFFDSTGESRHWSVFADAPLPYDFTASARWGTQSISDEARFFGSAAADDEYSYWSLGVSRSLAGFDLDLTFHDTDTDTDTCSSKICDSKLVFTIGKEL